jgi:hypothetical protein
MNYAIGYVLFPTRIWRTIRNVFLANGSAATVFEHRLKDLLGRQKGKLPQTEPSR